MLSTRELTPADVVLLVDYWMTASPEFLRGMGADHRKLPSAEKMAAMLQQIITIPLKDRPSYCLIWLNNGEPIGHSNTNPTCFGKEAFMHLHLWETRFRQKGMGAELVKMSLQEFFKNLQLERLYCQPYALNPAPNRTLEKVGFEFVKEYTTVPGSINFEQPVKQWLMTRSQFSKLYSDFE